MKTIQEEHTVEEKYSQYFREISKFLLQIEQVRLLLESGEWEHYTSEEKKKVNAELYQDIVGERYLSSYSNPTVAVNQFGEEVGRVLSSLYVELRSEIVYVYEQRLQYLTICNELFIQVYNCFEESLDIKELKEIIYWYVSDYCDVYMTERIKEQIDTQYSFGRDIIEKSDLSSIDYLYDYGEYLTENEIETAKYLQRLPEETVDGMARVYVDGFKNGFINTGKDLSIKSTVNIRYVLGFELVVKRAIELFAEIGLSTSIYRASASMLTKRKNHKLGYYGAIPNKQYEYDHKDDIGIVLDKRFLERKLEVTKTVYETYAKQAAQFAGPAVIEVFGETPFAPVYNENAVKLTEKQEKLSLQYDSKTSQLVNQYIKGEERSFTIISYPIPEIGEQFEEIFTEVIKINTLDADVYETVQQHIIDALDQAEYVRIVGKGENRTHLNIQMQQLNHPERETLFENCVADVNIPVGEVFTSPMLEGSFGVLHVKKVFLNELQYTDLEITFEDGKVVAYNCSNFAEPEENIKYIKENIMNNHETLPIGEFAIGTNTTAYVVAKKYQIEDKLPILIAEKMGPHFAVGDTCYSWSEDVKVYNPNGKEIIAKDNSVSILRKEDLNKAYVQCHTDITIPYEELQEITAVTKSGMEIKIIENERFVLKGTEVLNEPFDK
ncbi:MAG: aminopeptidase [Eubacteriales bacterium]